MAHAPSVGEEIGGELVLRRRVDGDAREDAVLDHE
jgi:hypothetical protein